MREHHEHLDLARRHLAEAEARIARQRELIAELRANGHSTRLAHALLASFVETMRQMEVHREYLERSDRDA